MSAEVRQPLGSIVLNNQNKTNSCINNNINSVGITSLGVSGGKKGGGGLATQVFNRTANVSNIDKKNFPYLSLTQTGFKRRRHVLNVNTKDLSRNEKCFDFVSVEGGIPRGGDILKLEKNTNKKMKSLDIRNYICVNNYTAGECGVEKENVNVNNLKSSLNEKTDQEQESEINSCIISSDDNNKQTNKNNSTCTKEVMNREMNKLNNDEEKSRNINQVKTQKSNLAKIYPNLSSFPALSSYSSCLANSSALFCFSKSSSLAFSSSSFLTHVVNKKIDGKEKEAENLKEIQKESVKEKKTTTKNPKLTIQCAMINVDKTSVYTPDFGFDNSHNNFWSNTSYEQKAAIADEEHAENYLKDFAALSSQPNASLLLPSSCSFLFLSESMRSRVLSHLSILSDSILKNRKSVDVFSIACTIFDRYMSLQKKELLEVLLERGNSEGKKKTNLVNLSIKNVNNSTNNVNNSILYFIKKYNKNIEVYYEIVALSCYCIAIKHDAIEPSTPEYILNVWKDVLKNTNFFAPWRITSNVNELNSRKKDLILIEFRILNSLLSNVALPTATIMVEDILNPRSRKAEEEKNVSENMFYNKDEIINETQKYAKKYCRTSIEKYNSMSTECQILLRLSMLNTNIFLNYKPSIQTYACASLCNQTYNYIQRMQKKLDGKDSNKDSEEFICECKTDDFIQSVRSSGVISIDEDIIQNCKNDMMNFFLFIFNLQKIFYSKNVTYNDNRNPSPNYANNSIEHIKQKFAHFRPICEWMRSLQSDNQIRNLILHMKMRYAHCLSKCNHNKSKTVKAVENKLEDDNNNNVLDVNSNFTVESKSCCSIALSVFSSLYSAKNTCENEIKQIIVK